MSYKKMHVPHPFPEALPSGHGWVIEEMHPGESMATTNIPGKRMRVPLKNRIQERNVRAHEMGHAAWSPKDEPGKIAKRNKIEVRSLQVAEDLRVNMSLNNSRVDIWEGLQDPDGWEGVATAMQDMVDNGNVEEAIQTAVYFTVSAVGTDDRDKFIEATPEVIRTSVKKTVNRAATMMAGRNCYEAPLPWKRTIAVARYLDSVLPVKQAPKQFTNDKVPDIQTKSDLEKLAEQIKNGEIEQDSKGNKTKPKHLVDPESTWGDMTIETPPRRETAEMRRVAPVYRSCDSGTRIRSLSRLHTDGKIFGYRVKQAGGTCLIDVSGSMYLSPEDIYSMVSKAPHATVAIYAGGSTTGTLRILIKGGRSVEKDQMHFRFGNNIIDGPALQWLARQQAPRVWISDGLVTGCNATRSPKLYMDRDRLVAAGKIKRVPDVEGAIEYFEEVGGRRLKR
jgi:hypothetical protein